MTTTKLTTRVLACTALVLLAACKDPRIDAREALARGKQLQAWHRDADAQAALREAARLDPALFEARLRLARIALDAHRFEEARTQAASVVRDQPRSGYALELLGRAQLALTQLEPALDALTQSLDADPSRTWLAFEIARLDERLGRHDAAIAAYRTLVHADAHALGPRVALAHALLPGPPRDEVRTLLAEAKPLAAPGSPEATEIDGLTAWCDRLDPPVAPPSPFGRDIALGNDPMSALRALMGDQIGDNFGFGGLGLRGTGRGGGRDEGTIGLGNLGTLGTRGGGGSGNGTGVGYGTGSGGFANRASAPHLASGPATVRGSLMPEVVRRVVQRHVNEVRVCYETELRRTPTLTGRVEARFVVSPDGSVASASIASSTLARPTLDACITSAIRRWTFPAPDGGGVVTVDYPFTFTGGPDP